jgi:hypothetical protein
MATYFAALKLGTDLMKTNTSSVRPFAVDLMLDFGGFGLAVGKRDLALAIYIKHLTVSRARAHFQGSHSAK